MSTPLSRGNPQQEKEYAVWWGEIVDHWMKNRKAGSSLSDDIPDEEWYVAGYWSRLRGSPKEAGAFGDNPKRNEVWQMGWEDADGDLQANE